MGYTTKYSGSITVDPQMDWTMRAAIREYSANADIGKVGKNLNLDGTCDWKPSDTGFSDIIHNGMEKSYDQDQWLQALINDLLKPAGYVCNGIIDCQCDDTKWRIYVRDNEVTLEDLAPGAVWDDKPEPSYAEQVNAPLSEETVEALNKELASDDPAKYRFAHKSPHIKWEDYKRERAERDKAVTREETAREKLRDNPEALAVYDRAVEAFKRLDVPLETLREILDAGVAGDDKKLEEFRSQLPPEPAATPEDAAPFAAAQADEALEALRSRLRQVPPEPKPGPTMFNVGTALRDLGNAIAFKATQGVDAVAGFVIDVEGALELCAEQGDTKPLDALFKSLRAEHDAEAERAEQSAAVDDDIPNDGMAYSNLGDGFDTFDKDTDAAVEAWEESLLDRTEESLAMSEQATPAFKEDASLLAGSSLDSEQARAIRAQAPELTAEDIAGRYPMTTEHAQEMIDGGAVESGGILFVNEAARDKFAASVKNDREAAENEHEAAWKKIHADQAAEERVMENLRAAQDRLPDDDNLETWEPRNEYWLVWSNKHGLWWMPNSVGYTEHVDNAGRYTFDQALAIVKKSSLGWGLAQNNTPPTTMMPDPDRN